MHLREYLFRNELTIKDFAESIDYRREYIGEICRGRIIPGKKLSRAIERKTEGQVTRRDLLEYCGIKIEKKLQEL